MATPYDFNAMADHHDGSGPSMPSPPPKQDTSSPSATHSPHSNVTIYQTTGPDAHTRPVTAPGSSGQPLLNPRSCVTCRRRKVRCDKQMPCSNCRRALIPCVFPAPGRAPRQTRPKDPNAPPKSTSQREVELVKRLKKLEGIVEELSGQIEVEGGARGPNMADSPATAGSLSPGAQRASRSSLDILQGSGADASDDNYEAARREVQKKVGRLVLDDTKGNSRYVSSGFWSKLNDELDAIREETQKLTDEDADDSEYENTPTESPATAVSANYDHHAFILGYRSVDVNLQKLHPLPSHSTFLWSVYQENVDPLVKLTHIPSVEAILREARRSPERLSPNHEALVFSVYFAAVVALESDEVQTNFNTSKEETVSQYRFAVEQALAKAGFLNTSDTMVLQAFALFLLVVRRYDESRFCWSLIGLLVRIAQGMGIHRDGTNFNLSPFETEMRRRLWWVILTLDLRSAEELGSDMMIADRDFDTRLPLNINDADISPSSTEPPEPREGRTETSVSLVRYEICSLSRRLLSSSNAMTAPHAKFDETTVAEKERMLIDVYQKVEHKFLNHVVDESDNLYWVAAMISRVIMAKMCLVIYQPMLFPGSEYDLSDEIRQRIFVASIEIIEFNYKLNTDPRCKQYRWLFKTYTGWHAIAYALIECSRRPWTALVERGWESVHGYGIDQFEHAKKADHAAIFLPLRKLFLRARKHREAELARLRANPEEARRLDFAERMNPATARFGPVPGAEGRMDEVRDKWRALVRSDAPSEPFTTQFQSTGSSLNAEDSPLPRQAHVRPSTTHVEGTQAPVEMGGITMDYLDSIMAEQNVSMADLYSVDTLRLAELSGGKAPLNPMNSQPCPLDVQNNDALRQQALLMQTQPQKDDNLPPYLWSDPFTAINTKLNERPVEDLDMIEDDFNWHDWSQSIRGLEIESTQPGTGW